MTAASPTVTILEPAEGAEIPGTSVTVRLTAEGVEIVPAGELVAASSAKGVMVAMCLSDGGRLSTESMWR